MDSEKLLGWLLAEADEFGDEYPHRVVDLEGLEAYLFDLNGRREILLPTSFPTKAEQMVPVLREHFQNNVTLISLVLNYFFPNKYIFYRVSALEHEIFEGLNFLSDSVPDFAFPFSGVIGKTGFDRYLILNQALINFAKSQWSDAEVSDVQGRLVWFLYNGIGGLFWNKTAYSRYWVMAAASEESWEELDSQQEVEWSGRKEMQTGDLVFMYRTTPRMAITDLYRVKDRPRFDPWGRWDGFWVNLEKICSINDILFRVMRNDPILGQWGVVRSQFQGATCEPIPASIYNRLLEKIPEAIRQEHELLPVQLATRGASGQYTSEAEFEKEVIEPLLKGWGFQYRPQYPCTFHYGSQQHLCWVDFYVTDGGRPLTLFENKLRIVGENELRLAAGQAKSYALQLGLPSFVVVAPEGIWIYSLTRNNEKLVRKIAPDELDKQNHQLKELLLELRTNSQ